jgi:hypothetical protein
MDRVAEKVFRRTVTGVKGKAFRLTVLSLFFCSFGSGGGSPQSSPPSAQVRLSNNPSPGLTSLCNFETNLTPSPSTATPHIRVLDNSGNPKFYQEIVNSQAALDFKTQPNGGSDFEKYDLLIWKAAEKYKVDYALVKAVIKAESNFDPRAISRAGAKGLMQLMPATADAFGVNDSFQPEDNVQGGVRYLRHLLDLFEGNLHLSLAAYNAGENAVFRYNGIPPYRKTQTFIQRVLRYSQEYDSESGIPILLETHRQNPTFTFSYAKNGDALSSFHFCQAMQDQNRETTDD